METKELKITIPENHEIDWQESAKQEKIVFKKIDNKPRSWEEYCKNNEDKQVWFIEENSNVGTCRLLYRRINIDKNTLPSKELAESFLAMMQLMSLRQEWIGNWKPDWTDSKQYKQCVVASDNILSTEPFYGRSHPLSFPTEEMATDFMNCFKDLLEIAKPLI